MTNLLSLGDLAHEICLPLLDISWKTILLSFGNKFPDTFSLRVDTSLSLLLCDSGLPALVSFYLLAEIGVCSPAVIKVDSIGWRYRIC